MTGGSHTNSVLHELDANYRFSVAGPSDIASILALQERVYLEEYGRLPLDGLDEISTFLVARTIEGDLVASLRVIDQRYRPFKFEEWVNLDALLGSGRRAAEVGRWCIIPERRVLSRSTAVHIGMMKAAFLFSGRSNITDFLLYTYPSLCRFYRGLFFDDTGVSFSHSDWGEVNLMRLDFPRLGARLLKSETLLAQYLRQEPGANFRI